MPIPTPTLLPPLGLILKKELVEVANFELPPLLELQATPVEPREPEVKEAHPSETVAMVSPPVPKTNPAKVEVAVVFNLEVKIPLVKVEVDTAPVIFKYLASIPPLKVEVPVLETFNTPKVEVAA